MGLPPTLSREGHVEMSLQRTLRQTPQAGVPCAVSSMGRWGQAGGRSELEGTAIVQA